MKHTNKEVVEIISRGLNIKLHEEEWNKIIKENQGLLIVYDEHSKLNIGLKDTTRVNNFKTLLRLVKGLDKSFREITKSDINDYFKSINLNGITKLTYYHTFR